MKPPEIKYIPYDIKLNEPFLTSGGVIRSRKGFFIAISLSENETALGEASLLPEFGSESYSEAESALQSLFGLNVNKSLLFDPEKFQKKLETLEAFPALRHGLEQAWLNFRALNEKTTLDRLLNVKLKEEIHVNGLIGLLSPDEVLSRARRLVSEGFRTIKLKAGRDNISEDIKSVELIREHFGSKINIRLDVNGKWAFPEALKHIKELEELSPEYIEQPVMGKEDFFRLVKESKIPLAADEIIRSTSDALEVIEKAPGAHLILKPMMLGGITSALKIMHNAEASGNKSVISSSFETSVGRSAAIFLAAASNGPLAHGLGTKGFLQNEPYCDPFEIKGGVIKVKGSRFNSFN
ncbi:MAG TPA: o-succinylbenzoate synthase [Ignavibacteriales bacterium]|nr:o-succinylbenzoate synthase [Ignavibacteriales bacterium]